MFRCHIRGFDVCVRSAGGKNCPTVTIGYFTAEHTGEYLVSGAPHHFHRSSCSQRNLYAAIQFFEFALQITGAAYPLTFSWDEPEGAANAVLEIRTLDARVEQHPLVGKGSVVITGENLANARLKLTPETKEELPKVFALYQNYPNPFNPSTRIRYDLPKTARVSIKVFDLLGQEVMTLVDEEKDAGKYSAELNGTNLPSGVYYYRLEAGSFSSVRKVLLMK